MVDFLSIANAYVEQRFFLAIAMSRRGGRFFFRDFNDLS